MVPLIMLNVWREACRHIEIDRSAASISRLLSERIPLDQVLIRRFDAEHGSMVDVAAAPARAGGSLSADRRQYTPGELRRVLDWYASGRLLRRGAPESGVLSLLLPPAITADVVAVPLHSQDKPTGVLLVTAVESGRFDSAHEQMLDALREPFSVALENDRRIHEMATLREAAQADRGALLRGSAEPNWLTRSSASRPGCGKSWSGSPWFPTRTCPC